MNKADRLKHIEFMVESELHVCNEERIKQTEMLKEINRTLDDWFLPFRVLAYVAVVSSVLGAIAGYIISVTFTNA